MAKEEDPQDTLFQVDDFYIENKEWKGMPEFKQDDLLPWKQLIINFENRKDLERFSRLINQKITENTRSLWYPENEKADLKSFAFIDLEENES